MPLKDNTKKRFDLVKQGLSSAKTAAYEGASNFFNRLRINSTNTGLYERLLINDGDVVGHWVNKEFVAGDTHGTAGDFNNTGFMIIGQAFNTSPDLANGNVAMLLRAMANNDAGTPENTTYVDQYFVAQDITDGSEQGAWFLVNQHNGSDSFIIQAIGNAVGIGKAPVANFHTTGSTVLGADSSAIADGDMGNGEVNISTSGTTLTFKVKDASGTVRTGTVTLS